MSDSRQYDMTDMDNFYLAEENRRLQQLVDDLMADNLDLHKQLAVAVEQYEKEYAFIENLLSRMEKR